MNNKEYYFREDWKTFKKKYLLLCQNSKFNVSKFADLENKEYICRRIKIEEV